MAEQNRERQVIVAQKNKERTEVVEHERVEQAKQLEETEREKVVELARIEKEKGLEVERKAIQDVIRERITVEKAVVIEEERIKDTRSLAEAERGRKVAMIKAEQDADSALVAEIKAAEANKSAAEQKAKQVLIEAEAEQQASGMKSDAIKTMAEAEASQKAAIGMAEAKVMEAKASAKEKEGEAVASIIQKEAEAEAKGIAAKGESKAEVEEKLGEVAAKVALQQGKADAEVMTIKADAIEKQGLVEAKVMVEKMTADAKGVKEKAEAMKALDGVGREHEEFKLRLSQEKDVRLAEINAQTQLAESQASVLAEAMKAAKIEIIGGESHFFEQISNALVKGKSLDRMVDNSHVMTTVKDTFFEGGNGDSFKDRLKTFLDKFGMTSEDVKNLSISALLLKMSNKAEGEDKNVIQNMVTMADSLGIMTKSLTSLGV